MKMSLRAKLTGVILALAVLITAIVTVGSYIQMRDQLINTGIHNEVSATAAGTSALIKEWVSTRKAIVVAGVEAAQAADDPRAASCRWPNRASSEPRISVRRTSR